MVHVSFLEVQHPMKAFISGVMMVDGDQGVLLIGVLVMPNCIADYLDFQMMVSKELGERRKWEDGINHRRFI